MKLQFVIPAYKNSSHIEECISSLLAQEVPSDILICTSTPSLFLKEVSQKYDIPLLINPNGSQGIAADWNFAYQCADADLVVIAHQDDIYLPSFSQQAYAIFHANPRLGIAFTDCLELLDGQVMAWHNRGLVKKILRESAFIGCNTTNNRVRLRALLSLGCPISCPSVIFNKKELSKFAFSSRYQINLDWEAWAKLAKSMIIFGYIRKRLIIHRVHPESENQISLKDGRRLDEDLQMFSYFWPSWMVRFLSALYRFGY